MSKLKAVTLEKTSKTLIEEAERLNTSSLLSFILTEYYRSKKIHYYLQKITKIFLSKQLKKAILA